MTSHGDGDNDERIRARLDTDDATANAVKSIIESLGRILGLRSLRVSVVPAEPVAPDETLADLESAIVNLGHKKAQARRIAKAVRAEAGPDASFDDLIRAALRHRA